MLSVNAKAKTVTLKDGTTGRTVLGKDKKPLAISWDKLEPV